MKPRALPGPEIYEGIEEKNMPQDVQGWHSDNEFFSEIISKTNPETIIEVGSWKGASAITMARLAPQAKIICVDTWLGGIDHELNQQVETSVISRDHGYPTLYFQFLSNISRAGVHERVSPIPQTSVNGARLLTALGVWADLIYIDGSHELEDVYIDLCAYWDLLKPGGTMFGDDWQISGVEISVKRFCLERALTRQVVDNVFWCIRK